jgi:hypothetical protein
MTAYQVDSDKYVEWDAAYVLGSLSSGERREFELHFASCAACASAVAELAALPGLLGKVTTADAVALPSTAEMPMPATLLPRMVRSVRRRRTRVRAMVAAGVVAATAAAAVVALLAAGILPTGAAVEPARELALAQVVPSPLSANIRLVSENWGTKIEMRCSYGAKPTGAAHGGGDYEQQGPAVSYSMFVTGDDGRATQVATWLAQPGSTVEPSGTTSLAVAEIRSVEIRSTSGTVLLAGSP